MGGAKKKSLGLKKYAAIVAELPPSLCWQNSAVSRGPSVLRRESESPEGEPSDITDHGKLSYKT